MSICSDLPLSSRLKISWVFPHLKLLVSSLSHALCPHLTAAVINTSFIASVFCRLLLCRHFRFNNGLSYSFDVYAVPSFIIALLCAVPKWLFISKFWCWFFLLASFFFVRFCLGKSRIRWVNYLKLDLRYLCFLLLFFYCLLVVWIMQILALMLILTLGLLTPSLYGYFGTCSYTQFSVEFQFKTSCCFFVYNWNLSRLFLKILSAIESDRGSQVLAQLLGFSDGVR